MGHSSSIALGIAAQKPDTKIWCIDGDGAVLMHMGAMAVLGSEHPGNMIHIVINNGAHGNRRWNADSGSRSRSSGCSKSMRISICCQCGQL